MFLYHRLFLVLLLIMPDRPKLLTGYDAPLPRKWHRKWLSHPLPPLFIGHAPKDRLRHLFGLDQRPSCETSRTSAIADGPFGLFFIGEKTRKGKGIRSRDVDRRGTGTPRGPDASALRVVRRFARDDFPGSAGRAYAEAMLAGSLMEDGSSWLMEGDGEHGHYGI